MSEYPACNQSWECSDAELWATVLHKKQHCECPSLSKLGALLFSFDSASSICIRAPLGPTDYVSGYPSRCIRIASLSQKSNWKALEICLTAHIQGISSLIILIEKIKFAKTIEEIVCILLHSPQLCFAPHKTQSTANKLQLLSAWRSIVFLVLVLGLGFICYWLHPFPILPFCLVSIPLFSLLLPLFLSPVKQVCHLISRLASTWSQMKCNLLLTCMQGGNSMSERFQHLSLLISGQN